MRKLKRDKDTQEKRKKERGGGGGYSKAVVCLSCSYNESLAL